MANLLKVIFLGIMGFAILVFLTAQKPKKISNDSNVIHIIKSDTLPLKYKVAGKENKIDREALFKKGKQSLIIVANHDSLAVVKDLPKYVSLKTSYLIVANISAAPWFVKKFFIPRKLEEIASSTMVPIIYDTSGEIVNKLNVFDESKTKFFAFLLNSDGTIKKIYEGMVKNGALDDSMSDKEKKRVLKPLIKLLEKNSLV